MNYEIEYHSEIENDLKSFDNSIKIKVIKQIRKIAKSPQLGDFLGNKFGFDLSGYRKMYCCNKKIRIIYKIVDEMVVIKIVTIGKREDEEAYKSAFVREF